MCGIAGIVDSKGTPVESRDIEAMVNAIRHRGPDDSGVRTEVNAGLGSARLSILDPTPAGHMPMIDEETGNGIVHNGEIYNFLELPAELGLGPLKTRTDTEVILKAYRKLGARCVEHLNGIFAFAIWDAKRKELFCARDRLGVKPFFYGNAGGRFVFGSEAKALFAAGVPRKPSFEIIRDYLVHGIYDHSAESFFAGVRQLPPAHSLRLKDGTLRIEPYWHLGAHASANVSEATAKLSFDDACAAFADLAQDAVRLQLRSDVPVAVHTSGGLDSTLLMALLGRVNGGQGLIKAFCHVYGEEVYDERPHVDVLARQIGWDVEYRTLRAEEVPALAAEAMYYQEQPYPGLVTLAKQKLVKTTQNYGAKVVLEGQGGDEIGGGYQYYLGPHLMDVLATNAPDQVISEVEGFAARNGLTIRDAATKALGGVSAYLRLGRSADGTKSVREDCLDPGFVVEKNGVLDFAKPFSSQLLNMQHRDIFHTKLPRILRSCDRASMAHGRELRVPFLDHRLVEFTFALPSAYKIQNGVQRRFMREALKAWVPAALVDPPKRAVVDPQRSWLKGPLKSWVKDLTGSRSFAERGLFDAAKVSAALDDYETGTLENSFPVWQWVSMELWFRTCIDSPFGAALVKS